jgi:signal transduction histidine kinase/CheY-like chemotaxis protein
VVTLVPGNLWSRWLYTSACLGALATAGGAISLLGWILDVPRLADWAGTGITIKPNAAIAAVLTGSGVIAVCVRRRALAYVFGGSAALIGGATLLEHLLGVDLGIDTLLFSESPGAPATAAPGRMGPPASVSFMLVGLGGMLAMGALGGRRRRIAAVLGLTVVYVGLLSLAGYSFGAEMLYTLPHITGISPHTAGILAVLGVGLLTALEEQEPVRVLRENSAAGALARRALVFAVILPLVLGFTAARAEARGLVDGGMTTALLVLSLIALMCGVVWWCVAVVRARERTLVLEISKRERAQAALVESEQRVYQLVDELQAADRRKDAFLATLAHELRNPLAPIRNSLELLKSAGDDARVMAYARSTMERQLVQLVRLVDDLLDVSRITRDKLELKRERVEISAVVEQALESCRPIIDAARQALTVVLPERAIYVDADLARLVQVVGNLLTNASKYTETGGCIALRVEAELPAYVVIRVRDTGIGMPADLLPRVFEMFTQMARPVSQVDAGLGIGLALVKRLVEMHGGSVTATSDGPGAGSEFTVRLPTARDALPAAASHGDVLRARPATGRRILLVDDNRDAATSLAELLELLGHQVTTAHDGEDALAQAAAVRPEVILLDIGLPSIDGYACCRAIRKEPWGRHVRIVAITGWGAEEDRRKSAEAGFNGHLVKPVDPAMLIGMLASPSDEKPVP